MDNRTTFMLALEGAIKVLEGILKKLRCVKTEKVAFPAEPTEEWVRMMTNW